MERSYEAAIEILNSRQRIKRPQSSGYTDTTQPTDNGSRVFRGLPGIAGMSEWLNMLGHSETDIAKLPIIHIAGTKGKGSTCAFTESFLRAHGHRTGFPLKTGLYTSPHLVVPEERYRINGQPISPEQFARYFFEIYDRLLKPSTDSTESQPSAPRAPRTLQIYALLAFHVFLREAVDVAVIETHCGGEYDATNVIREPVVTAVTTLGMDHIDMLGPAIENIAWHKAGIFKAGAVALSAPQAAEPAKVLEQRASAKGMDLRFVERDPMLPNGLVALKPSVQQTNASVAAAAANAFLAAVPAVTDNSKNGATSLSADDMMHGVEHFRWPGRFQIFPENQFLWYLDAAHNEMSIEVAAKWFIEVANDADNTSPSLQPRILIFNHASDVRDATALLRCLATALHTANLSHVIFASYGPDEQKHPHREPSPSSSSSFIQTWRDINPETSIHSAPSVAAAIAQARVLAPEGMRTFVTGSQHLVGPALRALGWRHDDEARK